LVQVVLRRKLMVKAARATTIELILPGEAGQELQITTHRPRRVVIRLSADGDGATRHPGLS
jgi:hypothetical protein